MAIEIRLYFMVLNVGITDCCFELRFLVEFGLVHENGFIVIFWHGDASA